MLARVTYTAAFREQGCALKVNWLTGLAPQLGPGWVSLYSSVIGFLIWYLVSKRGKQNLLGLSRPRSGTGLGSLSLHSIAQIQEEGKQTPPVMCVQGWEELFVCHFGNSLLHHQTFLNCFFILLSIAIHPVSFNFLLHYLQFLHYNIHLLSWRRKTQFSCNTALLHLTYKCPTNEFNDY